MELRISANTIEELMEKVCAIANKFNVDLSEGTKTPVTAEVVEAAKTVEVEKEEKPRKTRKAPTVFAAGTASDPDMPVYTKADIVAACQKVSETKGLPVARELLATYGAKRVSDVKEEDYAEFIKACEGCLA